MDKRSRHLMDSHIAGFRYWSGAEVVTQMKVGDSIDLVLEDDNQHDEFAVALNYRGKKIGYLPKGSNALVSQLLYFGHNVFDATVIQIDLQADPSRQVRVAVWVKDERTK